MTRTKNELKLKDVGPMFVLMMENPLVLGYVLYTCANGVNIPGYWLCDGYPDCGNSGIGIGAGIASEDESSCGE